MLLLGWYPGDLCFGKRGEDFSGGPAIIFIALSFQDLRRMTCKMF